jgi:hypothetical protein
MVRKKAQAGAAGALLALIAVFIILYMLLIPPEMRDQLLNDGDSTGKTPGTEQPLGFEFNTTVISVVPGRIDYLKIKEYDHPLPAVNLYSTSTAKELDIGNNVYVKNGIFDKKTANITFPIKDPGSIESVYLSFRSNPNRNNKGILTVSLNGRVLFDAELGKSSIDPIAVDSSALQMNNVLTFEVSGVGYRFWTTNEYELNDIKLVYDSIDDSTQTSRNTFMVTETEKFNLEKATLRFTPDCKSAAVGTMTVNVNSETVYSAVPDCGSPNVIDLSPSVIEAGNNRVMFHSAQGKYLIDQISVKTSLKAQAYPRYDFELDDRLFTTAKKDNDEDIVCGDVDGRCPNGCDADLDKDCCLQETSSYWCDYQPANQDDRCRGVTSNLTCLLCPSGYEDSRGEPPELCDRLCGDDTDNKCPSGCSKYYDKDCCMDESEDNFWCDDKPKWGLETCKDSITTDECSACANGWESDRSSFSCSKDNSDTVSVLDSRYDVKLTLSFFDDEQKKSGKLYVNGYQFSFYTVTGQYTKVLDGYVEPGSNVIKIEPDQTVLDIRKLLVEVKY